ncbi:hypothetical protein [Staphylococcus phage vB_SauH_DELF3]|nr:hypothetical protein [Staphylococcus phage vB_SauH_DELF3]
MKARKNLADPNPVSKIRTQNEASSKYNNLEITGIYACDCFLYPYGRHFNKNDSISHELSIVLKNPSYNITAHVLDRFIMSEYSPQVELFLDAGRLPKGTQQRTTNKYKNLKKVLKKC